MAAFDRGVSRVKGYLFETFEVSVPLGILRQAGVRLKIQDLPFQMLLVLLERRGELVTKEELGKRLWDHKTYVEVDKSLYVMAGKLREVLGDNAAQPRFIKTVSGRGYCFIGDATPVLESVADLPSPHLVQKPEAPSLLTGSLRENTGRGAPRGRSCGDCPARLKEPGSFGVESENQTLDLTHWAVAVDRVP